MDEETNFGAAVWPAEVPCGRDSLRYCFAEKAHVAEPPGNAERSGLDVCSEQVLDTHGQGSYPNSGGMVDGSCDRGRDAGEADLSNAAGSVLSEHGVGDVEEMHFDRG